jgi:hypothetical protein
MLEILNFEHFHDWKLKLKNPQKIKFLEKLKGGVHSWHHWKALDEYYGLQMEILNFEYFHH